jgi:ferric-dicitrate binding protein FerR (iron transport regulator)
VIDPSMYTPRLDPALQAEQWRADREAYAAHQADLRRLREAFDEAERRAARAAARLELLEERQRESRALPPDLRWGFVGLGFLAIGGIVVPLMLMPQGQADYRPEHKILVIGLFVLGLVWVFGYFGFFVLRRTRSLNESSAE